MRKITSLDELKEIELEIMRKVHVFCENNKITYYLAYGTLIGAARHRGFIPWDDDIDIWMMRLDYEKFLSLFPQIQQKLDLAVVNHKTKPYFGRSMSKVIDTRTILTEPEYRYDDPIGVFVDIWPLDGLPKDIKEQKKKILLMKKLQRELFACITRDLKFSSIKEIKRTIKAIPYRRINPINILDKIDQIVKEDDVELADTLICPASPHSIFNKTSFKQPVLHKFEGCEFYVPSDYDNILSLVYGDWRTFPPKKKQVPHHIIDVYWK